MRSVDKAAFTSLVSQCAGTPTYSKSFSLMFMGHRGLSFQTRCAVYSFLKYVNPNTSSHVCTSQMSCIAHLGRGTTKQLLEPRKLNENVNNWGIATTKYEGGQGSVHALMNPSSASMRHIAFHIRKQIILWAGKM